MASRVEQLNIYLNQLSVGSLIGMGADRNLFTFTESYARMPNRPTLSLALKDADEERLNNVIWKSNVILPPYFSNLLPEGHLRKYLADLNKVNVAREFQLLAALGADLPGAIRTSKSDNIDDFHNLEEQSAEYLKRKDFKLRFSLGGVQMKFSAILETAGGLTIPVAGVGGSWIVKLASPEYPGLPENEFSMLGLAKLMGIEVAEAHLTNTKFIDGLPKPLPAQFGSCLAVKRFDRNGSQRIHIEDMAQVFNLPPEDKYSKAHHYDHIARLLWHFTGEKGLKEFLRRLVFNIGICNTDMHLKNWSIIYRDGINPELAPAYDFVATNAYVGHSTMALKLGGTKQMQRVSPGTFRLLTAKADLPPHLVMETVLEAVLEFKSCWKRNASEFPIPSAVKDSIQAHVEQAPLFSQELWKIEYKGP